MHPPQSILASASVVLLLSCGLIGIMHQVSSLTLAKKKAVLLRTRASLEAKLERLTRAHQLEHSKEQTQLEGQKAKLKLDFEKQLAETAEMHSEAEQAVSS